MNCSDCRWFIPSHSCKIHGGFCVGPFTPSCDGFEKHAPAPPAPDSGPVWTVIQKPIPGSSDAKHTALSGPLGDIFFSSTQDAQNAAFECNQAFKHGAASKQVEVDKLKIEREHLIEMLVDSTNQGCDTIESDTKYNGMVSSGALSAYASALRYLSEIGIFKIEMEAGRQVVGMWVSPEDAALSNLGKG